MLVAGAASAPLTLAAVMLALTPLLVVVATGSLPAAAAGVAATGGGAGAGGAAGSAGAVGMPGGAAKPLAGLPQGPQ